MITFHRDALRDIQARDPDAGPTEPTEAAYAAHRAWALAAHGAEVWALYTAGDWDTPPEW